MVAPPLLTRLACLTDNNIRVLAHVAARDTVFIAENSKTMSVAKSAEEKSRPHYVKNGAVYCSQQSLRRISSPTYNEFVIQFMNACRHIEVLDCTLIPYQNADGTLTNESSMEISRFPHTYTPDWFQRTCVVLGKNLREHCILLQMATTPTPTPTMAAPPVPTAAPQTMMATRQA